MYARLEFTVDTIAPGPWLPLLREDFGLASELDPMEALCEAFRIAPRLGMQIASHNDHRTGEITVCWERRH